MPKTNADDQLDVRCVQCSYELRGITQPVCPECGRDYKSLKAMKAECNKNARFQAKVRLATHSALLFAAISNGLGAALVMGHYWLALYLRNPWLPDPKWIGLFQLPVIGGFIRALGMITWIFIPIVTFVGLTAFATAFILRWVRGNGSSLKLSDWFALVIILVSCGLRVIAIEQGVTKWLFD